MDYLNTNDNIVALATTEGVSSVSIIRISGNDLDELYRSITNKKKLPKPNTIYLHKIYSPVYKNHLDSALISFFSKKSSFTGEEVLEINCHGGTFVASNIINQIIKSKLARHSLPGEFSFRAYSNGKIDLVQAEAINDLVSSETNVYSQKALDNVSGKLSEKLKSIRSSTLKIISQLEHELDFNENEIMFSSNKTILVGLRAIKKDLKSINSSFLHSKIIRNGIRVLILGETNVGKSSLFNYLMGYKRSIVSNISGTTRDTVESVFQIKGHRVTLVDSAGILKTSEKIEQDAVKRTLNEIKTANIIILVSNTVGGFKKYNDFSKNVSIINVLSKSDLVKHKKHPETLILSSKTGEGVEALLTELSTIILGFSKLKRGDFGLLINERQNNIINKSTSCIEKTISALLAGETHDIVAELLHQFINTFNDMSTPVNRKDIINNIFSGFCVGK